MRVARPRRNPTRPRLACLLASALLAAAALGPLARAQKAKEEPDAARPKAKVRALTEKNSGKKVNLTKGDTFTVTLDANATTGYWWSVVRIDPEVIVLQGKPAYKAYPARRSRP
ncbi:MAG: protease inhibitor I42 family protein [Gemmataceae bacterium]